ncbi:MAG: outer membrane protein assembly factor BamB [Pseudomarimonas sp.]
MRFRLVSLVVASLLVVSGCGIFKGKTNKENIEPPTELTDFDASVDVSRVWSAGIGDGERKLSLRQAPVIAEGRVFAASPDGQLTAVDASNGNSVWEVESELRWSGGPAVAEGTLIVGTLDGQVIAYNPDSGSERWRADVSSEVISAPAIARGLAVVRAIDGRVFAFAITTGERRWVYDRGLPQLTLRGNARPVIDNGSVYLGYDGGAVVALKLEDGSVIWEQSIAEGEGKTELERIVDIDGEIVASGSEVFVAAFGSHVVSLDAGSGRTLWTRDMSVYGGVALADNRILVSDAAGTVWALDRTTGASQWRQDGLAHRSLTTPGIVGKHVVVGDFDGYLHWLSLDSGVLAARERVARKPVRATPQIVGDVVYAVTTDGKLAAYRTAP